MSKVDTSTLGWVKREIDNTLKQARLALEAYAENTDDATRLRFFITHVHQVVGTLQMVELDGAALLAREIEAAAEAILEGSAEPGEKIFRVLTNAILSLSEYLEQLLVGRPDVPLRLIGLLNELRRARNMEPFSEVALFSPDLSVYPPRDREAQREVSDEEYGALARKLRDFYQYWLLAWLRNDRSKKPLKKLGDILKRLQELARFGAVAQVWWVAHGLAEALRAGGVEGTNQVKILFGRVDQQLRRLIEGGEAALIREPADELVKNMLYFVGQAPQLEPLVTEIRQAFNLKVMLPAAAERQTSILSELPSQEALRSVKKALGEEIKTAQEMLDAYLDRDRPDAAELNTLIAHLKKMSSTLEAVGVPSLKRLVEEVIEVCHALASGRVQASERVSMRMAEALILLEKGLDIIGEPDTEWQRQIESAINALNSLYAGPTLEKPAAEEGVEGIEISEAALTSAEFKQLLGVAAGEIRVNLKSVEEALEALAADPHNVALLDPVPRHLNQIQGALQILGQERAAELISITNQYVADIRSGRLRVDNEVMDGLAVAVGTIEAYLEGLEHDRPRLKQLIDNALRELDAAVTDKRITAIDPAELIQEARKYFGAWLADTDDIPSLRGLRQSLRDIGSLAERAGSRKIKKICDEMNVLLEIVTEDRSFLSEDIIQTLKRSFETVSGLAKESLQAEATMPAPGPSAEAAAPEPVQPPAEPARAPPATVAEQAPSDWQKEAEEVDEEILEIFLEEAKEVQETIRAMLRKWRAQPDDRQTLGELRRAFHTLKGSGRLAGATEIGELAWIVENLLNQVLNDEVEPTESMFAFLERAEEALGKMIADFQRGDVAVDLSAWRREAQDVAAGVESPQPARPPQPVQSERGAAEAETSVSDVPDEQEEAAQVSAPQAQEPSAAAETPASAAAAPEEAVEAEPRPTISAEVFAIFSRDARAQLETMEKELDACTASGAACQVSPGLLRAAHTLHGTSRSLGLRPMAQAYERLEEMLDAFASRGEPLDERAIGLVREARAAVADLLDVLGTESEVPEPLAERFARLAEAFQQATGERGPVEPWYVVADRKGREAEVAVTQPSSEAPPEPTAPETPPQAPLEPTTSGEPADPALLSIFHEEAVDILARIETALGQWRTDRRKVAAVRELKRALHTLKGSARMAGAQAIGDLSHNTESMLKQVEDGALEPDDAVLDLLDEVHDTLMQMVDQVEHKRPLPGVDELNARLLKVLAGEKAETAAPEAPAEGPSVAPQPEPQPEAAAEAEPTPEPAPAPAHVKEEPEAEEAAQGPRAEERRSVLRVQADLLDNLSNYAGEVSIARARLQQQIYDFREELKELRGNVARFRSEIRELEIQAESQIMARPQVAESSVEQDFDPLEFDRYTRLQQLTRSLSESLNDLVTIQGDLDNFAGDVETVLQQQARLNTELQQGLMRTRMISFATQTARLRHLVRQTAREVGKDVDLQVSGAEVEIDRKVLERMFGPFEHMIRNAVDHGIEDREIRVKAGKPARGRIRIEYEHEGNEVVIRFSDDGAGLNIDRIRRRALETGLVRDDTRLSDEELAQLIMTPGFTTAEKVTHLSGRGIGMDVVHGEVRRLGGTIAIDTTPGQGTTFTIRLPLSLSIMQALVVRAGEQPFAVPVASIISIHKVERDELTNHGAGDETFFRYRGQNYPVMRLAQRLGLTADESGNGRVPVLLVRAGTHEAALWVDDLLNRQEIVVKAVGKQVAELPGIIGATILGDGSVVLILDIGELWVTKEAAPRAPRAVEEAVPAPRQPVVMVVDDSLTVRKVTDRHLRKHGMEVVQAKDGVEALEKLRESKPDVMLVDIEMPRMDGYELTAQVRSNPDTRDIPIIIITSRAGGKHKKKAMELGANVYLSKPYQEEDLLANIKEMLTAYPVH